MRCCGRRGRHGLTRAGVSYNHTARHLPFVPVSATTDTHAHTPNQRAVHCNSAIMKRGCVAEGSPAVEMVLLHVVQVSQLSV